jgi:muramidase (phage lysozyme)
MGMFDGIFGGDSGGGLYGGMLSQQQQQAMAYRGLMAAAGAFGQAAMPSRMPVPIGAALGSAAAAMGDAQDTALMNALRGNLVGLQGQELRAKIGLQSQLASEQPPSMYAPVGGQPGGGQPSPTLPSTAETAAASGDTGGAGAVSSTTVDASLPPEARALLDSISGPESQGAYNIRYTPAGGTPFDSYAQHPGIYEPGPQGKSSAAGRYQIVKSTWDPLADRLGLSDFSPTSQDQGAWNLAQDTYGKKTGRDLLADLKGGDTSRVAPALGKQWPTIGRGIGSFNDNLAKYTGSNVPDFAGRMAAPEQGNEIENAGAASPAGASSGSGISLRSPNVQMPNLPSQTASGGGPDLAEGDSIGVGFQKYGGLAGNAVGGRNPQAVLDNIAGNLQSDPNYYQGKTVLLSSGTMNGPDQIDRVSQQIKSIQDAGGKVVLAGVDTGKFAPYNDQLGGIAKQAGVPFAGPLPTNDVHPGPNGYSDYVRGAGGLLGGGTAAAPSGGRGMYGNLSPASPLAAAIGGGAMPGGPAAPAGFAPRMPAVGPTMPGGAPQMAPGGGMGINPAYTAWAQHRANIASLLGINTPGYVSKAAELPLAGPTAAATAGATYPYDVGKIRETANEAIRSKLAESGMQIVNGQVVPIQGFTGVTTANARAKAVGEAGPKVNEIRPGGTAATGDQIAAAGGALAGPELKEMQDPRTGRTVQVWVTPPTPQQPYGNIMPVVPGSPPPGGTGASVTPAPGNPTNGLVGKIGPGAETEMRGIGETLGKEYGAAVDAYKNAQNALPNLSAMQQALRGFTTGPFAGDKLRLGKAWQDFATTIGADPGSDLAKWVASGEIINKSGTRLGFELARTLGSREAQNIVQQAITTNPGLANSPQGNEKLIGLVQQGLQRDIDRRGFYDQWLQNGHGSMAGAATAFDQAKPADYYVSQVLPLKVTSKGQYDALPNGTRYLDPTGAPRTKGFTGAQ